MNRRLLLVHSPTRCFWAGALAASTFPSPPLDPHSSRRMCSVVLRATTKGRAAGPRVHTEKVLLGDMCILWPRASSSTRSSPPQRKDPHDLGVVHEGLRGVRTRGKTGNLYLIKFVVISDLLILGLSNGISWRGSVKHALRKSLSDLWWCVRKTRSVFCSYSRNENKRSLRKNCKFLSWCVQVVDYRDTMPP